MSSPRISTPRQYGGPHFGATAAGRSDMRMPRFFKRLFKFPQMDFEMAVWEMTHLLIAPKKVFKSIYYHKQTRNTWHRPDPSFTYLLSFFLLLTSFAWSLAYTPSFGSVVKLALMFVVIHFLAGSLLVSAIAYYLVGRLLGPGIAGLPGRRRQQGLFGPPGGTRGAEVLEFGYCFDVSIRAFFPPYVLLYIIQYILMPVLNHQNHASTFFANLLYLGAGLYWSLITFLGVDCDLVGVYDLEYQSYDMGNKVAVPGREGMSITRRMRLHEPQNPVGYRLDQGRWRKDCQGSWRFESSLMAEILQSASLHLSRIDRLTERQRS
ncbi:hypothetical protein PV04_05502 [Phialophora macrospora]|uniref:UNC-50 family protein n=1 Tax=Phialophora macrospora TaxID=1851006 RepID=A0A0D2CWT4_9EURO|nr:hypothetical protein PV04_05502 [Phialophora macrospora]